MTKPKKSELVRAKIPAAGADADRLFQEVAGILEEARRQTVRTVNTNMVSAYWLIGWRIVEAEQGGKARAGYGERLMETLSARLTERYGKGHSVANLRNFRESYLAYPNRIGEIRFPAGSELAPADRQHGIQYPADEDKPHSDPSAAWAGECEETVGMAKRKISSIAKPPAPVPRADQLLEEAILAALSRQLSWRHFGAIFQFKHPFPSAVS